MSIIVPTKEKFGESSDDDSLDKRAQSVKSTGSDELVDNEPQPFKLYDYIFRRHLYKTPDLDSVATRKSVYDDPDLAAHYWPTPEYENIHRFDVKARWTVREERALVRKIDWRVMLWAAISFSALNLDRNNLSQANSDNLLGDLKLTTNDFNLGTTLFRLAFLCAELPSQLVSKKLGPDRWIPVQICLWSIVTICQFWLSGRTSFLVARSTLGFIQGGFIPDLILYMSYFYTKYELPTRLSLFWVSSNVCAIFASFLAVGVLKLRSVTDKAGWRWLFLVEGLLTLSIGIATFFMMPPSPTQTKTWFRPNGWFTEREEYISTSRILRDDPTKGDMHNREGLSLNKLWAAVCDYDLWPLYVVGVLFGVPSSPPSSYLTLSMKKLKFKTVTINLLAIPSLVGGMVTMFALALVSETVNERSFVSMSEDFWVLPCLIALRSLPNNPNPWVFYAISTTLIMAPYSHPVQVGWTSRNAGAVATRTVSASVYNMCVQAGVIISANIYREDDAPNYHRGNSWLIAICAFNVVILYPSTKAWYIWRNRQKAKVWEAMTSEQKSEYFATTKDVGNKRLDFKFAH